jgi:hypothetical protein
MTDGADRYEFEQWKRNRDAEARRQAQWKAYEEQQKAARAQLREAAERKELNLESLIEEIADEYSVFSQPGYAEHFVQPYCACEKDSGDGGWWLCQHARDLGFTDW